MTEYRVAWKNEAGKEESVTQDSDYHPLTEQKARAFAAARKLHSVFHKDTDVRVEAREVKVSDWERIELQVT